MSRLTTYIHIQSSYTSNDGSSRNDTFLMEDDKPNGLLDFLVSDLLETFNPMEGSAQKPIEVSSDLSSSEETLSESFSSSTGEYVTSDSMDDTPEYVSYDDVETVDEDSNLEDL